MKGFRDHRHSLHECCKCYCKLVSIYLLTMASLHMAVDWSYLHKYMQAYYHNYTKPTRDQLILSREHSSQCIGREWIMILTTWYMHVSIVRTISSLSPKNQSCSSHILEILSRSSSRFCYHAGKSYLIIVDCYLDSPINIPMGRNTTASQLEAGL